MANPLKGKKIVLGITGSIAAYKACYIIRGLIKRGAEVQVVITPAGKEFITPITLSALTSKPVISEFFAQRDGTWNSHVDLGLWADAMLIAPATASTIGMIENAETGALESFNFEHLQKHVPELQNFTFRIDTYQFDPPMDSSDMDPDAWRKLVRQYRFVHFLLQGFRQRIETELTRPFNQNYFILQPEFSPANGFNQRSRIRIKSLLDAKPCGT